MPWFRMYAEFSSDVKVQSMDETLQRRFIMFLCLHCSGEFEKLSDEELAFALRITPEQLAETKRVFTSKGFLDENGKIRNWNKRQYKSDSSTERVQKHRDEKKKRPGNVSVTPSDSDSDSDSDTEKNKKTPSESRVALKRDGSATREVFEHWRRVWRHPDAKLDPKRQKRIEARLKDFTPHQLCDCISGFRNSPWHCGTDPKGDGKVYDAIDTLLRDTPQVEEGMRLLANPPRAPPKPETAMDRILRANGPDNSRVIEHDPEFRALTG